MAEISHDEAVGASIPSPSKIGGSCTWTESLKMDGNQQTQCQFPCPFPFLPIDLHGLHASCWLLQNPPDYTGCVLCRSGYSSLQNPHPLNPSLRSYCTNSFPRNDIKPALDHSESRCYNCPPFVGTPAC